MLASLVYTGVTECCGVYPVCCEIRMSDVGHVVGMGMFQRCSCWMEGESKDDKALRVVQMGVESHCRLMG